MEVLPTSHSTVQEVLVSGRVECPASGDVSVTLGSRSGSHEVNVYAGIGVII